jgi:preprotein translocase subunit SecE
LWLDGPQPPDDDKVHLDAPPEQHGGRVSDTLGDAAVPERRSPGSADSGDRPPLPARIALFYRQVIAELRKVIWPTRKELVTYTWVVIIFVVVVASIVAVFDLVFTKGVLRIFGH